MLIILRVTKVTVLGKLQFRKIFFNHSRKKNLEIASSVYAFVASIDKYVPELLKSKHSSFPKNNICIFKMLLLISNIEVNISLFIVHFGFQLIFEFAVKTWGLTTNPNVSKFMQSVAM